MDKDTVADRHKRELALMNIESALNEFLRNTQVKHFMEMQGGFFQVFTADRGVFVTVRGFVEGHVSINIEYFKSEEDPPLFSYEVRSMSQFLFLKFRITPHSVWNSFLSRQLIFISLCGVKLWKD